MRALEPDHPQGPRPPQLQPDDPAGRPDVREVTVPHWEQVASSPASVHRPGREGKCLQAAACTQRRNMMGKALGVAGDTRLRDRRQVSAAAWAPAPRLVNPLHSPAQEPPSQLHALPPAPAQATHCPVHCCGFVGVSYPPLIPRASQKASPEQAIQLQE